MVTLGEQYGLQPARRSRCAVYYRVRRRAVTGVFRVNVASTFELEYNDRGDRFTTSAFQLLQWKHALKLEKLGMTMSRGKKVSTHMKRLMNLKRTTPIDFLIEWTEGALKAATGE